MFKIFDRVKVISSEYCCANLGDIGTLLDDGPYRFLVRWEANPTMLWGVHSSDIELVKD